MNGIDDGQIETLIENKIQELFSELAEANDLRTGDIDTVQTLQISMAKRILTNVVIRWITQNKG